MKNITALEIVNHINSLSGRLLDKRYTLSASINNSNESLNGFWLNGLIEVSVITDEFLMVNVGDFISNFIIGLPLEFVTSDESSLVAWYKLV